MDLGASPGSWTLFAADRVGPKGRVLAVDLNELDTSLPPHAEHLAANAFEMEPEELGGPFEVVLSDMAPKTSGQRHADQYRSYELFMRALELAKLVLVPGGRFVGKIFQGGEFDEARAAMRAAFGRVRIIRPKATRDESYEVFLVGLGRSTE